MLLDFPLELGFFKTNNYVDPIDSSQIAVGNTLYAQIHFPLLIPGMQFSIDTCSVSDKAIAGSNVDVVTNNCEIDGLDFGWTGESDSAVQFQFTSFIFSESGETADMSMDCDVSDYQLVVYDEKITYLLYNVQKYRTDHVFNRISR